MSDTTNSDEDQVRRDTSYSPASEREMKARDDEPRGSAALDDEDINPDDVNVLPGTGGPDDVGDVDVDQEDLNLPFSPS
jgi:hypothetical protein